MISSLHPFSRNVCQIFAISTILINNFICLSVVLLHKNSVPHYFRCKQHLNSWHLSCLTLFSRQPSVPRYAEYFVCTSHVSHGILKSYVLKGRDVIQLSFAASWRAVWCATGSLPPHFYCKCLVVKNIVAISTVRTTALICAKAAIVFPPSLLYHQHKSQHRETKNYFSIIVRIVLALWTP